MPKGIDIRDDAGTPLGIMYHRTTTLTEHDVKAMLEKQVDRDAFLIFGSPKLRRSSEKPMKKMTKRMFGTSLLGTRHLRSVVAL